MGWSSEKFRLLLGELLEEGGVVSRKAEKFLQNVQQWLEQQLATTDPTQTGPLQLLNRALLHLARSNAKRTGLADGVESVPPVRPGGRETGGRGLDFLITKETFPHHAGRRETARTLLRRLLTAQRGLGVETPHPAYGCLCEEFLEREFSFHRVNSIQIEAGGSIKHRTATVLNYDLDYVISVPNRGNRRIWRRVHGRLQELLRGLGQQVFGDHGRSLRRGDHVETFRAVQLPSVAASLDGLSDFHQKMGVLHSSVLEIAVFPAISRFGATLFDARTQLFFTEGDSRDHCREKTLTTRAAIAKDYLAAPFRVDLRLDFENHLRGSGTAQDHRTMNGGATRNDPHPWNNKPVEQQQVSGLQTWWSLRSEQTPSSASSVEGDHSFQEGDCSSSFQEVQKLNSLDEILEELFQQRLHPNVASLINLAKRWVKERFPRKETAPLNGVSVTLFCLRFLFHVLGGGGGIAGGGGPFEDLAKFGEAMGVGKNGGRRHLILQPGDDERVEGEFVLELFFSFMRFIVGEAEQVGRCVVEYLAKMI